MAGLRLMLIPVGAVSPSVMDTAASETLKPVAAPDTVKLSTASPAIPSSVPDRIKVPEPLNRPPGMVTVKSFTAA